MSRGQRLASLAVAAVIAIVAVVVLRPGSEEPDDAHRSSPTERTRPTSEPQRGSGHTERRATPPEARYETIRFEDGRPLGGARDITVQSGDTVRIAVRSDRPEEIHIHGYERYLKVEPGRVARVRFPARLEGVFEVEAHSDGTLLANLRVEP